MNKGETNTGLDKFSIDHDRHYIIPLIKEALVVNKNIKTMASPWSAPGWMKTTGNMIKGRLKPEYYEVYAKYFTRFIEEYEKEGI